MKASTLLLLTGFSTSLMAQNPKGDIPPVSETSPNRVRIPIAGGNTAAESVSDRGDAQGERLAFSIAAQAKGWVPEGTSGILRNGMMCQVTVMVQGNTVHSSEVQRINESGKIGLPLVNNVRITDKSIETIEKQLTEAYKEFYRDPLVNVEYRGPMGDPSSAPWGFVTLMGNVGSPGPLVVPPTGAMTVSGAIKKSGGLAESAKPSSIRIYRPHPQDKTVERINVDLLELGRKGKHHQDIILLPGDVLYVPERIL